MRSRAVLVPLVVGAIGLALGCVQLAVDPARALYAYCTGFVFALSLAVGALVFVMIAHTARARWFVALRRVALAMASSVPLFVLFFLPIALDVRGLYPWARAGDLTDPETARFFAHQRAWMNVPFFLVRSFAYLLAWSAFAVVLRRASVENDLRPRTALVARERFVAALGIPVMALTLTFATFDWIMSLEPRFSSDMLGLYVFASAFAGAMGAISAAAWLARRARVLPDQIGPAHFSALGRVCLVATIFWSYIAFCQLLLVWIADLPREASFYEARVSGAWKVFSVLLFATDFVIPFLALLSRPLKRGPATLAVLGAWLVLAHALDVYWLVMPALRRGASVLDLAFSVGLVGVSAAFGAWRFGAAAPVPLYDPELAESLRYESP